MKAARLLFCFMLLLIFSCENETQVRPYPKVTTNAVFDISTKGAVFSGSVSGDVSKVTDHGFAWAQQDAPSIDSDYFVKLGPLTGGDFEKEVRSGLDPLKPYFVRAFVVVGDRVIYGPAAKFESMGSVGPQLVKLSKSQGQYLDTLQLTVRNLPAQTTKTTVVFDKVEVSPLSTIDSTLRIVVPFLSFANHEVKVRVDSKVTSALPFTYLLPVVESVEPKQAVYCDSLTIKGKYFPRDTTKIKLFIGSNEVTFKRTGTNILKHRIWQSFVSSGTVELQMKGLKVAGGSFTHLEPMITSAAASVKPGDTVSIKGVNLPTCDVQVTYPDKPNELLKILKSTTTEMQVVLPKNDGSCYRPGSLSITPPVTGTAALEWTGIKLKTDQIYQMYIGDEIRIKGAGFGIAKEQIGVRIGTVVATVLSVKDDEITAIVPNPDVSFTGTVVDIEVSIECGQHLTFEDGGLFMPAIITDFNPTTVTQNTTLTVTGRGFDKYSSVIIDDYDFGTIGSHPGSSSTQFQLNLLPFLNQFGTLISSFSLTIKVGGLSGLISTSPVPVNFNYITAWANKGFLAEFGLGNGLAAATSTHGYFLLQSNAVFYEFDPATNNVSAKAALPGEERQFSVVAATSDRIFFGLGQEVSSSDPLNDWWMFNPSNNTWTRMADLPSVGRSVPVAFTIDGKIYAGGGYDDDEVALHDFYVYDPTTNIWTSKASLPAAYLGTKTSMAFQGKGYVYAYTGLLDELEYTYDPVNNQWSERPSPFGFENFSKSSVVLSDEVITPMYTKFVPGTNTMQSLGKDFPTPFLGFAINGIVYMNIGMELWTYDPSK